MKNKFLLFFVIAPFCLRAQPLKSCEVSLDNANKKYKAAGDSIILLEKASKSFETCMKICKGLSDENSELAFRIIKEINSKVSELKDKKRLEQENATNKTKTYESNQSFYTGPKATFTDGTGNSEVINNIQQQTTESKIIREGYYIKALKAIENAEEHFLLNNNSLSRNSEDYENQINALYIKLEHDTYYNVVAKHLFDSTKKELEKVKPESDAYHLLVYTYLQSALYYGWNLMDKGFKEETKQVFFETENYIKSITSTSALIYAGLASFHSAFAAYYEKTENLKISYEYRKKSVEYAANAVLLNKSSPYYQRRLSLVIRNISSNINDTLILSREDKQLLRQLSCAYCLNQLKYFTQSSLILDAATTCVINAIDVDITKKDFDNALLKVKNQIALINQRASYNPVAKEIYLQKARLFVKLSSIFTNNLRDTLSSRQYVDSIVKCIGLIVKDTQLPITDFWRLEDVFDKLCNIIIDNNEPPSYKITIYKNIIELLTGLPTMYYSVKRGVNYIVIQSNTNIADLLYGYRLAEDTLKAIDHYKLAIEKFETADLLPSYSDYSEDFSSFCRAYSNVVKYNILKKNFKQAAEVYQKMIAKFYPLYKQYPFDFYLISNIKSAAIDYGAHLYSQGKYETAIPVLSFASYEGDSVSTALLATIYKTKLYRNMDSLKIIEFRLKYQRKSIKKFTIPTWFGNTKYPFDVYVLDRDTLYPYRGIEDQAEWVAKARGGEIPKEVREAFLKLQKLAWKNNVSFNALCAYALEAADEEKEKQREEYLSAKYRDNQLLINNGGPFRITKQDYDKLFELYEYAIKKDSLTKGFIKKNVIVFYLDYADSLASIKDYMKARAIYQRVQALDSINSDAKKGLLKVDFYQNTLPIEKWLSSNDIGSMLYLQELYLKDGKTKDAESITKQVLSLKDNPEIRESIWLNFLIYGSTNRVNELFLTDSNNLKNYRDYFIKKINDGLAAYPLYRVYYTSLIAMDLDYAKTATDLSKLELKWLNEDISSHYNSLAWYCILTKKYTNVLEYLEKSKQYDPQNLYPDTNIPHYYLFTGDYPKAKEYYLSYKDKKFGGRENLPTYGTAFLEDFDTFEKDGLFDNSLLAKVNELRKLIRKK